MRTNQTTKQQQQQEGAWCIKQQQRPPNTIGEQNLCTSPKIFIQSFNYQPIFTCVGYGDQVRTAQSLYFDILDHACIRYV